MSFGMIGPGFSPGEIAGGPAPIGQQGPGQLAGGPADFMQSYSNMLNATPTSMYSSGQNPVAEQTQQMAANPVYGQSSPFQPPRNVGNGQLQSLATRGVDPIAGFPYSGAPQGPGQLAGGPAAIDTGNMGFGKSMAGPAMALSMMPGAAPLAAQMLTGNNPLMQSPGQMAGGPAAINQRGPGQLAGGPAAVGGPQFQGGLRAAPRNYRPPMRRQYPRSLIGY